MDRSGEAISGSWKLCKQSFHFVLIVFIFQDHINEIISKWQQIDDEIWAKVIIFEKNRRVAKAYARSSVISINDSKHGFDGVRIGLNGFENPMRDSETKVIKKSIGDGFKIKMDEIGNIFIKRYGKSGVFVHTTGLSNEDTVIGSDIQQNPKMALNLNTSSKVGKDKLSIKSIKNFHVLL